ncbi:MAG: hypothetical protein OXD37_06660 [Acidimicrobiaceae bacterium]|nr:hypothetical protein [Acidimicrobiaceae bacterium]
MADIPDERWRAALAAAQDKNRRQFVLAIIYAVSDFCFAVLGLAGSVYLVYNDKAVGVFLAFVGAIFANVRRLASIAQDWLDELVRPS